MTHSATPQIQLDRLSAENARLRRENQQLARSMAQLRTIARTIVDEPDKSELILYG